MKIGARVLDLQLDKPFRPKWSISSFWAPDPKTKVVLEIESFDWIRLMILDKMSHVCENWS